MPKIRVTLFPERRKCYGRAKVPPGREKRIVKESMKDGVAQAAQKYGIHFTTIYVIKEYDKRADAENLIGEAKQEGLEAIPSSKFASNYAYFQIVCLRTISGGHSSCLRGMPYRKRSHKTKR